MDEKLKIQAENTMDFDLVLSGRRFLPSSPFIDLVVWI